MKLLHQTTRRSAPLILGSLALSGCTTQTELQTREQLVSEGSAAPSTDAVFFVEVETPQGTAVCSATLITPHLLLTAAHCATGQFGYVACETTVIGAPLAPSAFRVINEGDLTGPFDARWSFLEPDVVEIPYPGASLCGHDLALLGFETPIGSDVALPLALAAPPSEGDIYRVVGYGAAHPSGTGERLRRISSELAVLCRDVDCGGVVIPGVAGASAADAPSTNAGEFLGSPAGCPGDSGGPALTAGDDSTDEVVGVLSRGAEDCSVNVFSDANTPEVRALVRTLSKEWNAPVPPWALEPKGPTEEPALGGAGGTTSEPSLGGSAGSPEDPDPPSTSPGSDPNCQCHQAQSKGHIGLLLMLVPLFTWLRRTHRTSTQPSHR